MTDSTRRQHDDAADGSKEEVIADLFRQLAELQATVADLKADRDALAADHRALQAENWRLRREMTLSHLIENLQELDDELDDELAAVPSSSVQHLYDQLPDRFRFATFFRRADEAGWEAAQARHFLVRCLADERLVQAGAYLEKTGKGE